MEEKFDYMIGGKRYTQRKLVLGQVKQLVKFLGRVNPTEGTTEKSLLMLFGEHLDEVLAIVLCEDGTKLKDKDSEAVRDEMANNADVDMALKVVEDFFICNPIASLSEKLTILMSGVVGSMKTPLNQ